MKKLLFVLCSLLFVISGMAQSRRYYCEMIGRQTGFDSEKKLPLTSAQPFRVICGVMWRITFSL